MKNNISARVLFTLAAFGLFPLAGAQSLQPIDPLQRPKTGAGSSSFSVTAGYNPSMTAGGVHLGAGLGLTASYNVTEKLAVTASTGTGVFRTERLDSTGAVNVGVAWPGTA